MRRLSCVALTALCFASCDKAVDMSSNPTATRLIGRCVQVATRLFLVERTEKKMHFPEITRVMVVPPGSSLAPYSVATYEAHHTSSNQFARVVRIVRPGAHLRILSVWRLQAFEGDSVAVMARLDDGTTAELSWLMTTDWRLPSRYSEGLDPVLRSVFPSEIAVPCE